MLLIILFHSFLTSHSSFCGHKAIPYEGGSSRKLLTTLSRASTWSSMRMEVSWSSVSTSSKSKYQKYLQAGYKYFSNSLKVHQITSAAKWDELYLTDYDYCSDYEDYKGRTINNTDYLLVIQEIDDSESSAIAMAGPCAYDPATDQPIAGVLIMNLAQMLGSTSEQLVMIFTHELAHAFGFSSSSFKHFRKSNGEKYSESEMFEVQSIRGLEDQVFIKTPNVLKRARAAFDCETLPGLQIENQGGSGSAGSHWESRVMRTELMNPQLVSKNVVYSDLTLALFEDSGWYKPDYGYSSSINFGYMKGCAFHYKKCIVDEKPLFHEFCTNTAATLCSASHLEKGKCKIVDYGKDLDEDYQYFTDPEIGGNAFTDYCPLVSSAESCRGSNRANVEYGEKFCDDCRCIEGNFGLSSSTSSLRASCHEVDCVDGVVVISVSGTKVYCEQDGQMMQVEGFKGKLKCPNYNTICVTPSCVNNCYGDKCYDGVCESSTSFSITRILMLAIIFVT